MHQYKYTNINTPMQGIENSEINLKANSQRGRGLTADIWKTFKSQLICIIRTKHVNLE